MATGTATLDFGAAPGADTATVTVTGQAAILAGSLVEAWLRPAATADHDEDDYLIDGPIVQARDIVAGVGFTIYGYGPKGPLHGQWTVAWAWV